MAARGRPPGVPSMKATLAKYLDAPPSAAHYTMAERALKLKKNDLPRDFPHVRALLIYVDTLLWAGGDQHARAALFDRVLAKESRVVVDGNITTRRPVGDAADVAADEARKYMERLEGDGDPTLN